MDFPKHVLQSIYSPEFYKEIPKRTFWASLKYFFLLVFLLTIVQATISIVPTIGTAKDAITTFISSAVDTYPRELVITIKDGQASSNVKEPYFILLPEVLGDKGDIGAFENILVIDTQTPFSASKMNEYQTWGWLTKDSFFYYDDDNLEIADLSNVSDFTLDRRFIDSIVIKLMPYLSWVEPIIAVVIFLVVYSSYSFRLLYLLFFALLLLIIAKVMKFDLTYGDSYKIGLHAVTAGFLIQFLLAVTGLHQFISFPFMFTLITLGVVLYNLSKTRNTKVKDAIPS